MLGLGVVGLLKDNDKIIDTSFDILSLEALFLVPRYGVQIIMRGAVTETAKNILSPEPQPLLWNPVRDSKVSCDDLHVLSVFHRLPSLREMTRDFVKFLGLVVILYLGAQTLIKCVSPLNNHEAEELDK